MTTDASGDADIDATLTATAPEGDFVTATATAPDGSTSEFSACFEVQNASYIFGNGFEDGTTDAWSATVN